MLLFYIVFLLLGLLFVIVGGNILVKSSVEISRATKIPEFIVGATIVSIFTTLPEFLVTLYSCKNNMVELAVGNAVGSMLFNITLIIGVCLLFMPTKISRSSINKNMITLIVSTLLFFIFSFDNTFNKWQGLVLTIIFVINFVLNFIKTNKIEVMYVQIYANKKSSLISTIFMFLFACIMVSIGADLLVKHSQAIASYFGISEYIIGSTIIAIGTSAPDFVTAISAIRLKKTSLVIGSTIGSNIINSTLLVGISSFFSKGEIYIENSIIRFALPLLFLASLIIYIPILIKQKTYRWQGVMLLCITILYYITLFV